MTRECRSTRARSCLTAAFSSVSSPPVRETFFSISLRSMSPPLPGRLQDHHAVLHRPSMKQREDVEPIFHKGAKPIRLHALARPVEDQQRTASLGANAHVAVEKGHHLFIE